MISSVMPLVYKNWHTSCGIRHSIERDPHFTHGCKSSLELILSAVTGIVMGFLHFNTCNVVHLICKRLLF